MNKEKIFKLFFSIIIIIGVLALSIFLIIDLYEPMKIFIQSDGKDIGPLRDNIRDYGFWRFFFVSLLQCLQVLFTFLPAEPIQIIAGLTCGPIWGFLCSLIGVFIGSSIIFFLVKVFKKQTDSFPVYNKRKGNDYNNIHDKDSIKSTTMLILSLYFAPAIPYGMIAFTAAKSKMKYFRYILVTTIGVIPSLVLCIAFGKFFIRGYFLISIILIIFSCLLIFICSKFGKKIINNIINQSYKASAIWIFIYTIELCLVFFFFMKSNITGLLVIISIFIVTSIMYTLFNKQLSNIFERRNLKYDMNFFQGPVRKANPVLYAVMLFFIKIYFFNKYHVKVDKSKIKNIDNPSILIFNHPSAFDFIYSFVPYYPKNKVNPVVAYYYFCNRDIGKLIHALGGFPKYLFQPDISAMKNISRVIRNKGILGIAPEGRLSAYGELESIIPSTAKMIKKFGVQVIISKISGSYLTKPKWASTTRRGLIEVEYKEIFSKEEIASLSIKEIYNKLYNEIYYDEFKWQEQKHIKYTGKKFAEGLEQILYICPVCHKEFTYFSKNNVMKCSHCNTEVTLNNYYEFESENQLIPSNIKKWYLYQKDVERERIQDEKYKLTSNVTLKLPDPDGKGFKVVGSGVTTLTHQGITYVGTINGESKEIFFKIENIPALPFGVKEDFEIYHDNTLYYFIPDNIRECVKWSVVEELIYEKYIKDNNIDILEK